MRKTAKKPKYIFYILKCGDKSLYCGIAKDARKRESQHNLGKGSTYVRSRSGGKIIYTENFKNKSLALRREAAVKKWPRLKKLELIKKRRPPRIIT
ncbi:MAG: hypothetical protein A3B10_00560 [Candidatus Doudnabacteria bacterium RIFCSPLOWO2_01_FULL_44_21]|uniref:GIY-YIG domain-containing protein n=1 Tax=Candidatus Doudnabacteria bacterium RIFCSPLOWO2_01_FULL_44_21 TaxID=1817841 RepID=A0A1F5PYG9_9BACT|nr:MAG: hypothetical protein A3B95_01175 [Candidatus Doudnabacteria bacterium RIFCSPHIGHO2_02_FULL_43_13b]OGE94630.1 MAG: hypothetical protein A3B10_00560 [Candidatus Doudnabacteria bacterium RIFCSPLOWO2_01_FULL_44_21]